MKRSFFVWRRRTLLPVVIVAVLLLVAVSSTSANSRTTGGGDLPFYARIEPELVVHTDEWAAVVFYRPPTCVPEDFNLLDVTDFENAFGCIPPTTEGFMIWPCEPWSPECMPIQINLHGLGAVPVWFVSWPELRDALLDDQLTMVDLETMDSLQIGSASFYRETLHPTGLAQVPMINYVAHGTLDDGRSFKVSLTWPEGKTDPTVRIVIR